ncbi:MAG: MMPL family transporter [Pseudomonadota bacterium]
MRQATGAQRFIVAAVVGCTEACVSRPWRTILAFLALALAGAAIAAATLRVDTDPGLMISNEPKFSRDYQALIADFPVLENGFLIVVDAGNTGEGRRLAGEIADHLKTRPGLFTNVFAPGHGRYFETHGLLYLPEAEVDKIAADVENLAPLLNSLSLQPDIGGLDDLLQQIVPVAEVGQAPAELARLLGAMADTAGRFNKGRTAPLDWSSLGNKPPEPDRTRWYVFAKPVLDYSALEAAGAPMREVRSLSAALEKNHPGVSIRLTGAAAIDAEEFESVSKGAVTAAVTSFVLVALTILIGFPVLVLLVPALALIVLGFLATAGFAALSIGYLNMISVAFAVLFIGLGIDYAVHVVLRFAEERAKGRDQREAAVSAVRHTALPLTLCTVTTSLAFLSFGFTDFVGMAQLGVISAGGVVIALLASVTLVPAILVLLPVRQDRLAAKFARLRSGDAGAAPGGGGFHLRAAAIAVVVLAAFGAFLLKDARFDGDPLNLKDPEAPSMIAFNDIAKDEPGQTYAVQFVSKPGPELTRLVERAKALPEVSGVRTIEDLLPENQDAKLERLNRAGDLLPAEILPASAMSEGERREYFSSVRSLSGRIAGARRVPERVQKTAKRLAENIAEALAAAEQEPARLAELEAALIEGFPSFFQDIRRIVTLDRATPGNIAEGLKERYVSPDGRWRVEILPSGNMRDPAELNRFVTAVSALHPDMTGASVDIKGSADVVAEAMRIASFAALVLVCLVLFPVLRSVRDVLLVLAPLVLAGLLVVGYSVAAEAPFNFANVIVIPLLIGLGVDSAIHYVLRARGESERMAVSGTWTPRAVLISAITTLGSFGTLWMSGHRGLASMGELLSISIVATLLCTLVVLPELIRWIRTG